MLDIRLRSKISAEELDAKVGKILGPVDYNLVLTGPTRVRKPDGRPLCVYLPGAMMALVDEPGVYEVLHEQRGYRTSNRGQASGTKRIKSQQRHSYARRVPSSILGAVDPMGHQKYCRLTAWTGRNIPEWEKLHPMLKGVAAHLAEHVPDRYAAQQDYADRSDPSWIVPGTPFTTLTVNNTWPTGVHTDKGDLDAGFSTITCIRKGLYHGGELVFPEYRVAVDLRHGDLILMDAHEWHGNTPITCACGVELNGMCGVCDAERISVVAYYRTKIADCGTPEEELRRADLAHRQRAKRATAESGAGEEPETADGDTTDPAS